MKIGIAGNGKIVTDFMEAVKEVEEIEVIAICCREKSIDKGRKFAADYNFNKVYTNYEDMLNDKEIDFIYIALPNSLHYEYTKRALEYNKNVICEKPFTSTLKECNKLCNIAKRKGLFLFEAITTIHNPNFKFIQDNLNKIGEIKLISCNFSQYSSRYDSFLQGEVPIVFNPEFSGGALFDLNVYNIYFVYKLFGKPQKVNYNANKAFNGIDTSGIVTMKYKDFNASCIGAKDCNSENKIYIQGTKGYIKLTGGSNECKSVSICLNNKEPENYNKLYSKNRMIYELESFRDIFNSKDYDKCYEYLHYTKEVMEILIEAKNDAGIIFKADK